jgi:hypothetical protein
MYDIAESCREEGARAFLEGVEECPHPCGSENEKYWWIGFQQAERKHGGATIIE